MTKAYKFDLKVKGQHRIGNMNVRDTSSYGDTPMQNMVSQFQTKKSYGPDLNLHRQTDRQTDRVIPSFTGV